VVPGIAGVKLPQLGFRPWRDWTATEKSYFLQVLLIANVAFPIVLAAPIKNHVAQAGMAWGLWNLFVPYLLFGFYQELVYRGMVQLELVRRRGAPIGIVVANVLYTFGPLHWYYFATRGSLAVPMFASIFVVGLLFLRAGGAPTMPIMGAVVVNGVLFALLLSPAARRACADSH